jgi:hypothetical protein
VKRGSGRRYQAIEKANALVGVPQSTLGHRLIRLLIVLPSALRRPAATLLALLVLTLGGATACGGEGAQTDCSLTGCTVTFPRSGDSEVSLLGIKAKLVGAESGSATLEVAGQTVTVPVGGQVAADNFTVGVERITDTEVVVRISQ